MNRLRVLLYLVDLLGPICLSQAEGSQDKDGSVRAQDWLATYGLYPPSKVATHSIVRLLHILREACRNPHLDRYVEFCPVHTRPDWVNEG